MRTASTTYAKLKLAAGSHYEVQVARGSTLYGMDKLYSCEVVQSLFDGDGPKLGGTTAAQCTVDLIEDTANWPRMAEFTIRVRLKSEDDTEYSEWINIGTFYTDERSEDGYGRLTIIGYDKMLMTEKPWLEGVSNLPSVWPLTAAEAVDIIRASCDIQIDSRTILDNKTRFIGMSTSATAREILRDIGSAMGGNWCITPEGKLYLVPFGNSEYDLGLVIYDMSVSNEIATIPGSGNSSTETYTLTGRSETVGVECAYVGKKAFSLNKGEPLPTITGIELSTDDEIVSTSGTKSGYVIKGTCNFTDDTISAVALANVRGYSYKPFSASGAIIDPLAEVGDIAIIDGDSYQIIRADWLLASNITADISAPIEREVDHEYTVQSEAKRVLLKAIEADEKLERRVNSYIEQTAESITLGVESTYETKSDASTKYEALDSKIEVTAEGITSTVSKTYTTKEDFDSAVQSLQDQLDDAIETFSGSTVPTLTNYPANTWSVAERANHVGDLYIVNSDGGDYAGFYYRFEQADDGSYRWSIIEDTEVAKALAEAEEANRRAQEIADNLAANYSTTTQMQTAIEQSANSIKSTVSSTYQSKTAAASDLNTAKSYADTKAVSEATAALTSAKGYTDSQLQDYSTTEQMQSQIEQTASDIKSTVSANYETKSDANSKLDSAKSYADSAADDAETAAKEYAAGQVTAAKAEIKQTTDAITSEVSKKVGNDEVISRINQSAEKITIDAAKVDLKGYVTFTNLETEGQTSIHGGNIETGTVTARSLLVGDFANYVTVTEEVAGSMLPAGHVYGQTVTTGSYVRKGAAANAYLGLSDIEPNSLVYGDELYYELTAYAGSAGAANITVFGYDKDKTLLGGFASGSIALTTGVKNFQGTIRLADMLPLAAEEETLFLRGTLSGETFQLSSVLATAYDAATERLTFGGSLGDWKYIGIAITGTAGRQVYVRNAIVRRKSAGNMIVDGSLTAEKLAAKTITGDQIKAASITGDELAANSVQTKHLTAESVTGEKIKAGAVTADKINVNDLYALAATIGGFVIGADSIHNGMTSLGDTAHDGVYVGTDGIALGKGKFKVTAAGELVATNARLQSGDDAYGAVGIGDGHVAFEHGSIENRNQYTSGSGYVVGLDGIGIKVDRCFEVGIYSQTTKSVMGYSLYSTEADLSSPTQIRHEFDGSMLIDFSLIVGDGFSVYGDVSMHNDASISGNASIGGTMTAPQVMQSGRVTVQTLGSGRPGYVDVTFSTPFPARPTVVATPVGGTPGTKVTGVSVADISATGCRIYANAVESLTTSSEIPVNWIAVYTPN